MFTLAVLREARCELRRVLLRLSLTAHESRRETRQKQHDENHALTARFTTGYISQPGLGIYFVKNKKPLNFESTLNELENLVEQLERGDLTLEESLKQFELGMRLVQSCQQSLQAAEQKVQILTRGASGDALQNFAPTPEPDDEEN